MFDPSTRFLIVDDFGHTRSLLRSLLKEMGYASVEEAADGEVALEKLRKAQADGNPFGFIFSDWNMPKLTGLGLLKACRSDADFQDIPFIILTVESEREYVMQAISEGVNDYVLKPFTLQSIKEKLQRVYSRL